VCELLMGPRFAASGGEPSPQFSVTDVRSLSWSVQPPLAVTASGALPEAGLTERAHCGEAAWATAAKPKHIRMPTTQLRRFTTFYPLRQKPASGIARRSVAGLECAYLSDIEVRLWPAGLLL
jgi:hypothetical protein